VRIRFLSAALRDLDDIEEYIARDNPTAARAVGRRIAEYIDKLNAIPYLGRPGAAPGTRILVVPRLPYVVIDEVRGREIMVLGVTHGARNWQADPRLR
jgi:plasmid stabilization system protein ParE